MAIKHTEDFKQEAVRIALTSGLSRRRIAADLGVGLSTPKKEWGVSGFRYIDRRIWFPRLPSRFGQGERTASA